MENLKEILTTDVEKVSNYKDIPFAIAPLGEHCMDYAPHRHTFYEVLFVSAGEGYHVIDFEPYKIKPPLFYFISPGQVHFWKMTQVFEGHFMMFTDDFLIFPSSGLSSIEEITFFHTVGESPELFLSKNQSKNINDILSQIYEEYKGMEENWASVLRAYLHILITRLQRISKRNQNAEKSTNRTSLVRRFKHLLGENILNNLTVQEYADIIGVSTSHLNNILKSTTGYTPAQLIRNEMLLEAKRMLVHTEQTVSEISYHFNFEDPSYFSRFFRREIGVNPKQFQTEIRQKYRIIPE